MVAPCLCKGTQRWIHRDCLDRWRATGMQRALTNCRECGFQYHLVHSEEKDKMSEGQHRFLQKLGAQSLTTFILIQASIIALGVLVRCVDAHERLVDFFSFPQEPGGEKLGGLFDAFKYHKTTYYVAGLLALLLVTGIVGTIYSCCTSRGRRELSPGGGTCDCNIIDVWACNMCCDDCGSACSHSCACGPHCCDLSVFDMGGVSECGECLLVGVVVAIVLFVIVGIFMAVVAIVTAIMRFAQQWARLTQMRMLAKEYVVEDLAAPDEEITDYSMIEGKQQEMSSAKHPPERPDADQVQLSLAHDLNYVFGTEPQHHGPGYGTVV